MTEMNHEGMKEGRLRRSRISRLKSIIIAAIVLWMCVSMLLCLGLLLKVGRLDDKIAELAKSTIEIEKLTAKVQDQQTLSQQEAMQEFQANETVEPNVMSNDGNRVQEGVKQKVYLTFDDGPSENTARILDILKEKKVKATFFVVGNEDEQAKALYQRIVDEGHTIGMHSFSHKYSVIYESLASFSDDLHQLRNYIQEITGVKTNIMRFPGGSSNQVSNTDTSEFIQFLKQEGITYYDWNVISGDASSQTYTAAELTENVVRDVKKYDTSVVLMHDASTKTTTVEALGPMIDELLSMGMEILPISSETKLIQHISVDSIPE